MAVVPKTSKLVKPLTAPPKVALVASVIDPMVREFPDPVKPLIKSTLFALVVKVVGAAPKVTKP